MMRVLEGGIAGVIGFILGTRTLRSDLLVGEEFAELLEWVEVEVEVESVIDILQADVGGVGCVLLLRK
jgi:hypothetical protein